MNDAILIRPYASPDEDFDSRHQASMEVFSTEQAAEPEGWGICLGGDATAQIGGQMMVFNWFESRGTLLSAISEHLVYTFLPPQGYDLSAARRRVASAVAAFTAHSDPKRLAEDLCNALRSHVRIDWIGPVSLMMTSDDDFARRVRADFLDLQDTAGVEAIDPAQESEFRDFLSSWISGT